MCTLSEHVFCSCSSNFDFNISMKNSAQLDFLWRNETVLKVKNDGDAVSITGLQSETKFQG